MRLRLPNPTHPIPDGWVTQHYPPMPVPSLPLARYLRVIPTRCYSPIPGIEATIDWLLEQGYPPLPIVPQQCAYAYPKLVMGKVDQGSYCPVNQRLEPLGLFSGKNPSYFQGQRPRLLRHRVFTERLPTTEELKRWFEHPQVGIATLGGWQQTVWVDLDAKCFGGRSECERIGQEWLDFIPALKAGFVERTQSGGWRLAVRCQRMPTFSKIAFSRGGVWVGEALGQGVPAVLAPTVGPKGVYESVCRGDPLYLESMASISLYPAVSRRQTVSLPTYRPLTRVTVNGASVSLQAVLSQRAQQLLQIASGVAIGQRSDVFVTVAREVFGWERWLSEHGYRSDLCAASVCETVAARLDLDSERTQRILFSQSAGRPLQDSYPACHYHGGDAACEARVRLALK